MPNIAGPATFTEVIPVFPLPGALLLPRGPDAAQYFRAALISQWWTMRCATVIG